MNEYGTLVEWQWQVKTEVRIQRMCPHYHSVRRMDWPGNEPAPRRLQARIVQVIRNILKSECQGLLRSQAVRI